jgi:hypothetical protein
MRHELIALHFGMSGNPNGPGTSSRGAQLYPVCINVKVTGSGTVTPPGVKFPGAYNPKDPGILDNIYFGPNAYTAPGPPVYQGKHDPPQGQPPVVRETGTSSNPASYNGAVAMADGVLHGIVAGVNNVLPGGGGTHYDVGQGALNQPVNGGKDLAPLENLYKGGLLPNGVMGTPKASGSVKPKGGAPTAASPNQAQPKPAAPKPAVTTPLVGSAPGAPAIRIKGRSIQ